MKKEDCIHALWQAPAPSDSLLDGGVAILHLVPRSFSRKRGRRRRDAAAPEGRGVLGRYDAHTLSTLRHISDAPSAEPRAARLAIAGIKAYCAALMVTQYFTTFALTSGESMQPTVPSGRWVRVDRLHRFPLKRNDFVMFASPRTPGEYSAKRVVGLVRVPSLTSSLPSLTSHLSRATGCWRIRPTPTLTSSKCPRGASGSSATTPPPATTRGTTDRCRSRWSRAASHACSPCTTTPHRTHAHTCAQMSRGTAQLFISPRAAGAQRRTCNLHLCFAALLLYYVHYSTHTRYVCPLVSGCDSPRSSRWLFGGALGGGSGSGGGG